MLAKLSFFPDLLLKAEKKNQPKKKKKEKRRKFSLRQRKNGKTQPKQLKSGKGRSKQPSTGKCYRAVTTGVCRLCLQPACRARGAPLAPSRQHRRMTAERGWQGHGCRWPWRWEVAAQGERRPRQPQHLRDLSQHLGDPCSHGYTEQKTGARH